MRMRESASWVLGAMAHGRLGEGVRYCSGENKGDATFDGKELDAEKPESTVNLSPSSSALSGEQDDMTKKKGKSPVEYFIGNKDLNADFEDYSEDSSNNVSAAGPIVLTAGQNYSNSTNPFSAAGPSNTNTSPTHEKSSLKDALQPPDMLEREDIAYSDSENVGAEADFNNLETSITKVWILVDLPRGKRAIGTKWVYRNKKDERGIVVRNKARLVAQGHIREEGIDYEEVFAPVARIKAIRLFLDYASFMGFMVYQMDVKSAFLYGTIEKEVLQALVNKKKVVVTEAAIRDALHLDDAEGVDCLPNEEIFTELARMGYEKPSTKLTFYKAFFSSQWKFLIHTILQSMSAKCTSWNEFSSTMASAVICLSIGHKFNFSKYIFNSLVRNVDGSLKFYMYPRFIHLIIQNQLGDLSTHTTKYISPALTQKVFANMRRVGKGCSGVETPLFEGILVAREPEEQAQPQGADFPMSLLQEALNTCAALTRRVEHLEHDKMAQNLEITKLKTRVKKLERANKVKTLKLRRLRKVGTSQRVDTPDDTLMEDVSNQGRIIDELDKDEGAVLISEKEEKETKEVKDITGDAQVEGRQADIYQIGMDHAAKVLSMQEDEPKIQEAVEVVTTAKLITEVVAAVSETFNAAAVVPAATVTPAPVKVSVPSTRRRRGVVIRDPEEESSAKTPTETKSKDKGKGIMVEEPKPMKKKQQVELDEAYARKLHEKLNQDINWEVALDHVKQKAKENPYVQRYQTMKKRPQTEAQARRNMMMYLKNTAGFRLDYFKGMSYDDIRLILKAKFNSNIEFLLKTKEQIEEEENRAIASINETPAQKATKKRRLNKEVEDVEELKQYLEIMPGEDDDVYTEATPLARKVLVTDYHIIQLNNKPHFKIIRADETQQLYSNVWKTRLTRSSMDESKKCPWSGKADYACRKKIPTLEVYIGSDAECSMTKSRRANAAEKNNAAKSRKDY
uniref:Copia protein n=1 Tax=Tanacetum cinerariifolium TaxID=118510 RepID=A0A6L2K324_TANCI|nr:copia protein [Tanacetum cinerariifolium]